MLLKQGTRNEERGASKATGRRKEEQSLTGTQTLSVTSFPTLCFRFFPFFIFPFPVLISRSPFLVLVTSLDSDRSFGPPVRGRSAGSFSEQRLVIEPIFFSAVSKIQYHFYLLPYVGRRLGVHIRVVSVVPLQRRTRYIVNSCKVSRSCLPECATKDVLLADLL